MKNYIQINNKINSFNEKIEVSGDKSISIRCVLMASQAIGLSKIYNLLESEDVMNALKAIRKLGIKYRKRRNYIEIQGFGLNGYLTKKKIEIDAGNSGTLARLILGLLVNVDNYVTITGDKSLRKRDFS
jgi:3-phosphoshikimate 1-carboxyvinyltransferase